MNGLQRFGWSKLSFHYSFISLKLYFLCYNDSIFIQANLPNYQQVWLIYAHFSALPAGLFSRMGKLEVLNLSNNTLVGIPEADVWSGLKSLEALHLTSNKLALIQTKNFENLPNLKRLYLDENKILAIDDNAFDDAEKLSVIDLSDNNLDKIMQNRFQPLSKLTELDLRNNKLKLIEPGAFDSNTLLNKVDLGQNKLKSLDENLFKHCSKLENLALDHNQLSEVLIEWQKFGHKVHLSLSHNLWNCECPMLKFINSVLNEGMF